MVAIRQISHIFAAPQRLYTLADELKCLQCRDSVPSYSMACFGDDRLADDSHVPVSSGVGQPGRLRIRTISAVSGFHSTANLPTYVLYTLNATDSTP